MRDKAFFGCGIQDWLQNCPGIHDSNICGLREWPQNHRGIEDSNISREWDKVSKLFRIREMVHYQPIAREIEIDELTPQTIKR